MIMDEKRKIILCLVQGYLNGKYEDLGFAEFGLKFSEILEMYGEDPELTEDDSMFFTKYVMPLQEDFMMKAFERAKEEAYRKGAEDKEKEINNKVTSDIISHIANQENPNMDNKNEV